LEVYGADNQLLARHTTRQLATGQIETMTLNRDTADIKYAIARSHNNTIVRFDHLRFGPRTSAVTDVNGTYALSHLNGGSYRVRIVPATGQALTNPANGSQLVILAEGEAKGGVDFGVGNVPSSWQNSRDRFDVNDDFAVTSNDVLRIINKLNSEGAGPLDDADTTPPFVDVNGDFSVTANDALQLINELNRRAAGEGEGEEFSRSFVAVESWSGEGESAAGEFAIFAGKDLTADQSDLSRRGDSRPSRATPICRHLATTALASDASGTLVLAAESTDAERTRRHAPIESENLLEELEIDQELVSLLATGTAGLH
jgi:hypothetical protein